MLCCLSLSLGLFFGLLRLQARPGDGSFDTPALSGIYPHLSVWNRESECGIGAVVPWADGLWLVTYAPHGPRGSTDKLYFVAEDLTQSVRPESVGGTPANRMIHRETGQLLIGPYLIDRMGEVRTIPHDRMPGRLTGTARHLVDPDGRAYYATMEEGLYDVDLESLEVIEIFADGNGEGVQRPNFAGRDLPGYHGKGLYAAADRLFFANNGDQSPRAQSDPRVPSGALASWRPGDEAWTLVRRNQFTELTGPGGIWGNNPSGADPIWALGWDHRSLLLGLFEDGAWEYFRLPKASYSYDGAHGWNTEWPRIREIGAGEDYLATMHGTFWSFPATFSRARRAGIRPRSNYLKVVGDFCRWGEHVVLGCDDVAASEFYNGRPQKTPESRAGQAHSNLWFLRPDQLDDLGPVLGRGALWLGEDVAAGAHSDPYLIAGYERRVLHLLHDSEAALVIHIEIDREGNGSWEDLEDVEVQPGVLRSVFLGEEIEGEWLRLVVDSEARNLTASLLFSNRDRRPLHSAPMFAGLAHILSENLFDGTLWATGGDRRTLAVAVPEGADHALYELNLDLELVKSSEEARAELLEHTLAAAQIPGALEERPAAWVWREGGQAYLFPKHPGGVRRPLTGGARVVRELATERDILHIDGSFFELPARNAGGVAYARPIATHSFLLDDFASFAGLLVLTGLDGGWSAGDSSHILSSEDGRAAVWAGALDDLWKLGKARGLGGPWRRTLVRGGVPSDPYLMAGYDRKSVELSHVNDYAVTITLQVDLDGTGRWADYRAFDLGPRGKQQHQFHGAFAAYWIRAVSDRDTTATVILRYD